MAETAAAIEISIHPPREGWDGLFAFQGSFPARPFQSTHPVRGGTYFFFVPNRLVWISIHPPREGWDTRKSTHKETPRTFQSTHPVRGGTVRCLSLPAAPGISIHPPREGWDPLFPWRALLGDISIHPPREGWDFCGLSILSSTAPFQSTHPVRGGTQEMGFISMSSCISIHPPREGWDGE